MLNFFRKKPNRYCVTTLHLFFDGKYMTQWSDFDVFAYTLEEAKEIAKKYLLEFNLKNSSDFKIDKVWKIKDKEIGVFYKNHHLSLLDYMKIKKVFKLSLNDLFVLNKGAVFKKLEEEYSNIFSFMKYPSFESFS